MCIYIYIYTYITTTHIHHSKQTNGNTNEGVEHLDPPTVQAARNIL